MKCSGLGFCIYGVARKEATGDEKKKGKRLMELEWATAHFLKLSHNTASCIMAHSRLSRHTAGSVVLWHTAD